MNNPEPLTTVLAFEGVTVRYGRKVALDQFNLEVPPGAVYALLGRNGAGKSSAIRCLLGYWKPHAGQVCMFGKDVWRSRAAIMQKVGIVPEEPDAPPDMTVDQLVGFSARVFSVWDNQAVTNRLERFGIPRKTPFGRLSKGQKGNVMLALALGHRPELLVLDDPTLGLDVVARKYFFEELVSDLADRGTTVFITTHDLAGIEGIADGVGILKEGRLVVNETMEALKAKFRKICYPNVTSQMLAGFNGELEKLGIVSVKDRGWGIEAVVGNYSPKIFDSFRLMDPALEPEVSALSLEDIFTTVIEEPTGGRP